MPVTIRRPGTVQHQGESDVWTFGAAIDNRRGVVRVEQPRGVSEAQAANSAQKLLEEAPGELEGITSTGGGGGLGLAGDTVGAEGGGGEEHEPPPRVQDKDGD